MVLNMPALSSNGQHRWKTLHWGFYLSYSSIKGKGILWGIGLCATEINELRPIEVRPGPTSYRKMWNSLSIRIRPQPLCYALKMVLTQSDVSHSAALWIASHPLRSALKIVQKHKVQSHSIAPGIASHPWRSALKILQTKKRSSELGVFSFWSIYSWPR